MNIGEYRIARDNICIIMWSCPGNMPKYYPGLRDILPDRNYYTECLIVQVICQNITVPNNTTETYTKYNNHQYSCNNPILLYGFVGLFSMVTHMKSGSVYYIFYSPGKIEQVPKDRIITWIVYWLLLSAK
jgi:hypothetical protein